MVKISTFVEQRIIEDDDMDAVGTKSLGCGNSFVNGRCNDGTDADNCVYKSAGDDGANKCIGLFHLVEIPDNNECKD